VLSCTDSYLKDVKPGTLVTQSWLPFVVAQSCETAVGSPLFEERFTILMSDDMQARTALAARSRKEDSISR
jgi:hypothetical protein